jgi:hypothetical protein
MTVFDGRAPRSAVLEFAVSRPFVLIPDDTASAPFSGRVVRNNSCTPERLRP